MKLIILIFFALEPLFLPSRNLIIVESHYAMRDMAYYVHMYYTLFLILSYQSLYIMYVSPIILVYHTIEHLFYFSFVHLASCHFVPTSVLCFCMCASTKNYHSPLTYFVPYPYVLTHLEGCHQLSNLTLN